MLWNYPCSYSCITHVHTTVSLVWSIFHIVFLLSRNSGQEWKDGPHTFQIYSLRLGALGSIVGWGTTLQAGRSRVQFLMRSLDFSIDLILLATLWPWGEPSL
jgi:hypothetical protein